LEKRQLLEEGDGAALGFVGSAEKLGFEGELGGIVAAVVLRIGCSSRGGAACPGGPGVLGFGGGGAQWRYCESEGFGR